MKIRVNVICLCAAAIGMVALLLPWLVTTYTHSTSEGEWFIERDNADLVRFVLEGDSGEVVFAIGAYLFALGVALCFWTPIGGVLQAGGIATYLLTGYAFVFGTEEGRTVIVDEPGSGAILAVVAAAVAGASLLRPVFIGAGRDAGLRDSRMLAWSVSWDTPARMDSSP